MFEELRDDYFFECFGILDYECESVFSPVGFVWNEVDVVMVMVRDDGKILLCHGIGIVIADS